MKWNRIALVSLAVLLAVLPAGGQSQQELVFVGSGRKNIEAFRFDLASGALTRIGLAAEIEHPSFLSISPSHQFLYSISEGGNAAASRTIISSRCRFHAVASSVVPSVSRNEDRMLMNRTR